MGLHAAMEEAQARLIGGEIESHFLGAAEHRYVLDHPGRRHPDDARDLKAVTVLTGEVVCLTNGKFIAYGPMGGGVERNHGPSMVFRVAGIDIFVITNNGQATGQFTSLGIDPTRYTTVAVKSMQHFRAAFEPLAREVILVDTGALCQVHYKPELFTKVRRPIWPLDPIEDPRAT
jgi:microcystin degradation protein MlrC